MLNSVIAERSDEFHEEEFFLAALHVQENQHIQKRLIVWVQTSPTYMYAFNTSSEVDDYSKVSVKRFRLEIKSK